MSVFGFQFLVFRRSALKTENRKLKTLSVMRWRKALAAFGAAALENEAATLRAHAHAEAVRLGAAAIVRLKSSPHTYTSRYGSL
jgi:hypothetical protein